MAGIFDEINEAVKQAVTTQSQGLKTVVIDELAKEKVKERKELLIAGIRKYGELMKDFNKAKKPDIVQNALGADGNMTKTELFSEAAAKKLKEAKEKLAKLDSALAKAVNEADFETLKKAVGNGPQTEEKAESTE